MPSKYTSQETAQQGLPTHNSYLNPAGVPFDLQSTNFPGQFTQSLVGPRNETPPVHTGSREGSHREFGGSYEPPSQHSIPEACLPYETQFVTVAPEFRSCYDDDVEIDGKSKTALVRHIPESVTLRGRSLRRERDVECIEWDEEYGLGIAVPRPEVNQSQKSPYPPAAHKGESTDRHQAERRQQNRSSTTYPHQVGSGLEEYGDDQSGSTRDSIPTQSHDRYGPSLRQCHIDQENRALTSEDLPYQTWNSTIHTISHNRSPRFESKRRNTPRTQKHIHLLEHMVDSDGKVHTTTQELHAKATLSIRQFPKGYEPTMQQDVSADGIFSSTYKPHVGIRRAPELFRDSLLVHRPRTLVPEDMSVTRKHQAVNRQPARTGIIVVRSLSVIPSLHFKDLGSETESSKVEEKIT